MSMEINKLLSGVGERCAEVLHDYDKRYGDKLIHPHVAGILFGIFVFLGQNTAGVEAKVGVTQIDSDSSAGVRSGTIVWFDVREEGMGYSANGSVRVAPNGVNADFQYGSPSHFGGCDVGAGAGFVSVNCESHKQGEMIIP